MNRSARNKRIFLINQFFEFEILILKSNRLFNKNEHLSIGITLF